MVGGEINGLNKLATGNGRKIEGAGLDGSKAPLVSDSGEQDQRGYQSSENKACSGFFCLKGKASHFRHADSFSCSQSLRVGAFPGCKLFPLVRSTPV